MIVIRATGDDGSVYVQAIADGADVDDARESLAGFVPCELSDVETVDVDSVGKAPDTWPRR